MDRLHDQAEQRILVAERDAANADYRRRRAERTADQIGIVAACMIGLAVFLVTRLAFDCAVCRERVADLQRQFGEEQARADLYWMRARAAEQLLRLGAACSR